MAQGQSRYATGRTVHSLQSQSTNRDRKTGPAGATIPSRRKLRQDHAWNPHLQEFPEMLLDQDNRPAEIGKRDPLRGATLTDLKIMPLDVLAGLGEQPFAQVPQDFLESPPQFIDRDFA